MLKNIVHYASLDNENISSLSPGPHTMNPLMYRRAPSYAQEYSPLCFHKVPIVLENSPIIVTYDGELCLLQKAFVWLAHKLSGYLGSWFVSRAV